MPETKSTLPPEKVFSIQIGTELFRLSGASIASDGIIPTNPNKSMSEIKANCYSTIIFLALL